MGDLADRVAALSPEKLELLERRLARRRASVAQAPTASTANASGPESGEGPSSGSNGEGRTPGAPPQATPEPPSRQPGRPDTSVGREARGVIEQAQKEPEQLLSSLTELSDESVDLLLRQMLDEGSTPPPAAEEPSQAWSGNLTEQAQSQGSAEELLENLDQFSDQDVDSLLAELLAAENNRGVS
jgi:hypothetical protein